MIAEINKTQLNKFQKLIEKNEVVIGKERIENDERRFSLAVSMSILQEYHKVDNNTALSALTDGTNDCKIDALYYDDTDDISKLIIVQSKYKKTPGDTGTFSQSEVDAVISNVKKIIKGQPLDNPNEKLVNILLAYRELLKDNDNPPIKPILYLATNGKICEGHCNLSSVHSAKLEGIDVIFIDASDFGHSEKKEKVTLVVNLIDASKTHDTTDIIFSENGVLCSTSIERFLKFYEEAGKDALFSKNVRYKIKKSGINKEIEKSFLEAPENFCFLNNGIYIACTDFAIRPTADCFSNLEITNPSIINGAQTTSTLYDIKNEKSLKKANIIIRIFKETATLNTLQITKATNSQNTIDMVDLEANNRYQEIIKKEFEKKGVGLLVKEGEDTFFYDDVINNEYLLQIYAAIYKDDPSKAKLSKAAVFKKYFNEVFCQESIDSNIFLKLWRCYEFKVFLNEKQESVKDEKSKVSTIDNAWYSIMYAMKRADSRVTDPEIPYLPNSKAMFENAYQKAEEILGNIIEEQKKISGVHFSLNNLFKAKTIKGYIDEAFDMPHD